MLGAVVGRSRIAGNVAWCQSAMADESAQGSGEHFRCRHPVDVGNEVNPQVMTFRAATMNSR